MRKLLYTLLGVVGLGCGVGMYAYASHVPYVPTVAAYVACAFNEDCEEGWEIVPKENIQNSHFLDAGMPRDPQFWIRAEITVPVSAVNPRMVFEVYDEDIEDWRWLKTINVPTGVSTQSTYVKAGWRFDDHIDHDDVGYWANFKLGEGTVQRCEEDVVYDHDGDIVN